MRGCKRAFLYFAALVPDEEVEDGADCLPFQAIHATLQVMQAIQGVAAALCTTGERAL